jgi:hypothetical protein
MIISLQKGLGRGGEKRETEKDRERERKTEKDRERQGRTERCLSSLT